MCLNIDNSPIQSMNGQLNMYREYFTEKTDRFGTAKANDVIPNLVSTAFTSTALTNPNFTKIVLEFNNTMIGESKICNVQLESARQYSPLPIGFERNKSPGLTENVQKPSTCPDFQNPQSMKTGRQNFFQNKIHGGMADGIMGSPGVDFTKLGTNNSVNSVHKFRNKNLTAAGIKTLTGQSQSGGSVRGLESSDNLSELSYFRRGLPCLPPQPQCIPQTQDYVETGHQCISQAQNYGGTRAQCVFQNQRYYIGTGSLCVPQNQHYVKTGPQCVPQNQHYVKTGPQCVQQNQRYVVAGPQCVPQNQQYLGIEPQCVSTRQIYVRSGPSCIPPSQLCVKPGPVYFRPGQSYYHSGRPYRCVSSYSREEPSFNWIELTSRPAQSRYKPTANETGLTEDQYRLCKEQPGPSESQLWSTKEKRELNEHLHRISKSQTEPEECKMEEPSEKQKFQITDSHKLYLGGYGQSSGGYRQSSCRNELFSSQHGQAKSQSKITKQQSKQTKIGPQSTKRVSEPSERVPGQSERIPRQPERAPVWTESIPRLANRIPGSTEFLPVQTESIPRLINRVPGSTDALPVWTEKIPRLTNRIPRFTEGQRPNDSHPAGPNGGHPAGPNGGHPAGSIGSLPVPSRSRHESCCSPSGPMNNLVGLTANQSEQNVCVTASTSSRAESKENRSSTSSKAYGLEIKPAGVTTSTVSSESKNIHSKVSQINNTVINLPLFPIKDAHNIDDYNIKIREFSERLSKYRTAAKCTGEVPSESRIRFLQAMTKSATLYDKQEELLYLQENASVHWTRLQPTLKVF